MSQLLSICFLIFFITTTIYKIYSIIIIRENRKKAAIQYICRIIALRFLKRKDYYYSKYDSIIKKQYNLKESRDHNIYLFLFRNFCMLTDTLNWNIVNYRRDSFIIIATIEHFISLYEMRVDDITENSFFQIDNILDEIANEITADQIDLMDEINI